jgi:hypothetical protein
MNDQSKKMTDADALAVFQHRLDTCGDADCAFCAEERPALAVIRAHIASLVDERDHFRRHCEAFQNGENILLARAEAAEAKVAELHLLRCERDEKQACIEVSAARIADLESRLAASEAEKASLISRLEKEEADARRYRWLRNDPPVSAAVRINGIYVDGNNLDFYIDSIPTIRATKGGGT